MRRGKGKVVEQVVEPTHHEVYASDDYQCPLVYVGDSEIKLDPVKFSCGNTVEIIVRKVTK